MISLSSILLGKPIPQKIFLEEKEANELERATTYGKIRESAEDNLFKRREDIERRRYGIARYLLSYNQR